LAPAKLLYGCVEVEEPATPEEIAIERSRRIRVSAWAYAYEVESSPIVDDARYDAEAALIRPHMDTGHAVLDKFFREEFAAYTGSWVHRHPELDKLAGVCAVMRRKW
jgi:hypothetical protein